MSLLVKLASHFMTNDLDANSLFLIVLTFTFAGMLNAALSMIINPYLFNKKYNVNHIIDGARIYYFLGILSCCMLFGYRSSFLQMIYFS